MEDQLAGLKDADRSLFPSSFTIRALRDSRYHNTAYAIAELIDNSVEADAEQIELLCMEKSSQYVSGCGPRISEIAVLDNGTGMDVKTLFDALKFGEVPGIIPIGGSASTAWACPRHQCPNAREWMCGRGRMARIRYGTPVSTSTLSSKATTMFPFLTERYRYPIHGEKAGSDAIYRNHSGTLVVWSKLDKIQWKTARAIIDNTSREVGRIHRQWIEYGHPRIQAASFHENQPSERQETQFVANDPLYLMRPTSTPAPWDNEPMFKQWGDTKYYPVTVGNQDETIAVKYSIVKPEALKTDSVTSLPGATRRGRHARHNIGVSVVREGREIVLEVAFLREGGSAENPQNRWWGCEMQFGRNCDELFGLDHNKQMVANFTQAAKALAQDDRPTQVILDELGIDGDPIYDIVGKIRDQTRAMMREIRQMFAQRRDPPKKGGKRSPEKKAVKTATDADRGAIESGREQPTKTDRDRKQIPPEKREAGLTEQFVESGQAAQVAQQIARMLVQEDLSYQFNPAQLDGYQMFNVRSNQGVLHINLNTDHPIYDLLRHVEGRLAENGNESDPAFQAIVAIRLLLSSWARMEDQTESREERTRIQDIAMNWGRQADKFINQLRERDD